MKMQPYKEGDLVKLFGSTSRARILTLLYAYNGKTFYQREIMFETGLSLQTTQRELNNLVYLGIVKREEAQNRIYYRINENSPFYKPLSDICALVHD
ncbi:MAG: winged helix-turn-helix transcriptional regulator [Deltaproteobacteria bacterium]|nr:winged helix-turn-helix transcriptional regulator [Deltaproteobacteria bacterium]